MELLDIAYAMWGLMFLRRVYNSYLEAVYCAFPFRRTQPSKTDNTQTYKQTDKQMDKHADKKTDEQTDSTHTKDLVGRNAAQVDGILVQDRLTFISIFVLDMLMYFLLPGFYPEFYPSCCCWWKRWVRNGG